MNIRLNIFELERMKQEISLKLYDLYKNYLDGNFEFPYSEVEKFFVRYELLYLKICKKRNSILNKTLSIISIDRDNLNQKLEELSRENIMKQVSKRIFGEIYFDVHKYIPFDEESKEVISNKLSPIVKNFNSVEIADIYKKLKKSASIRHVILANNSFCLLQQIFVEYIISVLSQNPDDKFSHDNGWTYQEVCEQILCEPVLSLITSDKNVRK